jgi:hypothetical protein
MMAKVIKKTSLDMRFNFQVVGGAQRERGGCHLGEIDRKEI